MKLQYLHTKGACDPCHVTIYRSSIARYKSNHGGREVLPSLFDYPPHITDMPTLDYEQQQLKMSLSVLSPIAIALSNKESIRKTPIDDSFWVQRSNMAPFFKKNLHENCSTLIKKSKSAHYLTWNVLEQ